MLRENEAEEKFLLRKRLRRGLAPLPEAFMRRPGLAEGRGFNPAENDGCLRFLLPSSACRDSWHNSPTVKKIVLVFFDAGGGHRAAATALDLVIRRDQRPWNVELLNLQELLEPLDVLHKISGLSIQDLYNRMLANRWTLGTPQLLRVLQLVIRARHSAVVSLLEAHWRRAQPDMVVSLIPHFNRALCESLARTCPGAPFVTVLTDFADYPPHFWIERQNQFFVCGTARAAEQARAAGCPPEHVFLASGMILHPRFYEPIEIDRDAERRRLGLQPNLPAGLVLFGGHGSPMMLKIAKRLDRSKIEVQLIFICGRNERLANALRNRRARFPMFVEGFTQRVPHYMHLADFFIGKPGPGSLSEALAMKLPVIVERNAWTLPQERYNADWVREQQVGIVLQSFNQIAPGVARLIDGIPGFRERVTGSRNRAVFEVPEFLAKILESSECKAESRPQ